MCHDLIVAILIKRAEPTVKSCICRSWRCGELFVAESYVVGCIQMRDTQFVLLGSCAIVENRWLPGDFGQFAGRAAAGFLQWSRRFDPTLKSSLLTTR